TSALIEAVTDALFFAGRIFHGSLGFAIVISPFDVAASGEVILLQQLFPPAPGRPIDDPFPTSIKADAGSPLVRPVPRSRRKRSRRRPVNAGSPCRASPSSLIPTDSTTGRAGRAEHHRS